MLRWEDLRGKIKANGLRNSLLIAVAPTAIIASIVSCYECIEPQVSNLFKRETLSGDFLQFQDIIEAVAKMDADVISIETSLITCGLWGATATETEMSFLAHAFRKHMTLSSTTFVGTRSSRILQGS